VVSASDDELIQSIVLLKDTVSLSEGLYTFIKIPTTYLGFGLGYKIDTSSIY